MFYSVPKRLRAKLSRRWRIGTYLGLVSASNEHYVATSSGNVVKARSLCRVVEASLWSSAALLGITGTPSKLCPSGPEDIGPRLEELDRPHADADESLRDQVDGEGQMPDKADKEPGLDVRITDRGLRLYGHTEGCPKCDDLLKGKRNTGRNHSQECRL